MSLFDERPDLAAEWHPTKNEDLTPDVVPAQSNKSVWWLGKCGHEWCGKISNRYHGAGCPYCSGRYAIKGINDLATTDPNLAVEWNYEKNGNLKPTDVKIHSNKKVWWKCNKGHEWEAIIGSRQTNGCPFCSRKKVLRGYNDLATEFPELVKEWHPTKNGDKTPFNVSRGHDEKVWWICPFGHEWEALVYNRIKGVQCPICTRGQRTSFSEQAVYYYIKQEYDDAISGDKRFGVELDVYIPSKKVAIEYDGYKWHSSQRDVRSDLRKNSICSENGITLIRIREDGCPAILESDYLKIVRGKYDDEEALEHAIREIADILNVNICVDIKKDRINILEQYANARKNKRLAEQYPELVKEWNSYKNGALTPYSINYGSEVKVWWRCNKGHEWLASPANRTRGKGCPYCHGKKVLAGYNDLATLCPNVAQEWNYDKNVSIKPSEVSKSSNKKVWWKCDNGHEWMATINSRTAGRKCPICSGRQVLKGYNDLATVSKEMAKEWNYEKNGNLTPDMFSKGSHKKVWWQCRNGHEWEAAINSRSRGRGCPKCGRLSAAKKLSHHASDNENR